jgi:hypothetical protein
MSLNYLIQVRRDTAANWSSKNPTLAAGEIAFEIDTKKVKIGDGVTAWNSLTDISGTFLATGGTFTGDVYGPTIPQSNNFVLNSGFDIWQRGTSFNFGVQQYFADQWKVGRTSHVAGATATRSTLPPTGFTYAAVIRRDSGNTATNALILTHNFEKAGILLRGKTVTLSFYARKNTNYSAAADALLFGFTSSSVAPSSVEYATGGLFLSSNPDLVSESSTATLTTTFQRFSRTFIVPETTEAFQIWFRHNPVGTAGGDDAFRITGVQLEEGEVATTYRTNGANFQEELSACQRYFISSPTIDMGYNNDHNGFGVGAYFGFPTTMRIAPTLSVNFISYDNAVNGGAPTTLSSGFSYRSFRSSPSWGYFRYGISYIASAEL